MRNAQIRALIYYYSTATQCSCKFFNVPNKFQPIKLSIIIFNASRHKTKTKDEETTAKHMKI